MSNENEMDRREFLKYSVATGLLVAAGEGIIESVMAQAATGITEADKDAGRQLL